MVQVNRTSHATVIRDIVPIGAVTECREQSWKGAGHNLLAGSNLIDSRQGLRHPPGNTCRGKAMRPGRLPHPRGKGAGLARDARVQSPRLDSRELRSLKILRILGDQTFYETWRSPPDQKCGVRPLGPTRDHNPTVSLQLPYSHGPTTTRRLWLQDKNLLEGVRMVTGTTGQCVFQGPPSYARALTNTRPWSFSHDVTPT